MFEKIEAVLVFIFCFLFIFAIDGMVNRLLDDEKGIKNAKR